MRWIKLTSYDKIHFPINYSYLDYETKIALTKSSERKYLWGVQICKSLKSIPIFLFFINFHKISLNFKCGLQVYIALFLVSNRTNGTKSIVAQLTKKKWNLYEHYIKIFQCYIYENRRCILYEKTMNKTNVFYMKNLWIKTKKKFKSKIYLFWLKFIYLFFFNWNQNNNKIINKDNLNL